MKQSPTYRFRFRYGFLDDGTVWVLPPSNNLFRIDQLTFRVVMDLQDGEPLENVCGKYNFEAQELSQMIAKFNKEKAVVAPAASQIVFEKAAQDISLRGYALLFGILAIIQVEYFKRYAHTYLVDRWQEGLYVAAAAVAVIIFHELGHYFWGRKYMSIKPKIGFTFVFIFPAVYVDTQQAWRLPRNMRLLINSAGVFADLIVNTIAITLVVNIPRMEYFVTPFLLTQYTRISSVLNPLFPTDGYWILSDLTRTVNLGKVGFEHLRKLKLNLYSLYGGLSLALMLVSTAGLLWFLYNLFRGWLRPFFP
ncbi:MAG TPA: hypothetical protein VMD52_01040 [Patescibacteria group bacterium]|nr:hypothetical protein [Patescibacteria group bacterium]